MRRKLQCLVLVFTAVAWIGNIGAAEYQAVPAQKIRPREGIGHVMAKIRVGQKVTVVCPRSASVMELLADFYGS